MAVNLPGFSFSLKEGYLVSVPREERTDTVLVIGSALDGPQNVPIEINSEVDVARIFGPVVYKDEYDPPSGYADGDYSGNNLVRDVQAVLAAGATRVLAVRTGGTLATGVLSGSTSAPAAMQSQALIRVEGLFPGAHYNGTVAGSDVNGVGIKLFRPSGATSGTVTVTVYQKAERGGQFQFTIPATGKIKDFIDTVNNHASNKSIWLRVVYSDVTAVLNADMSALVANPSTADVSVLLALSGGKYGTKHDTALSDIYTALTDSTSGTFAKLTEVAADIYVLSALYADDVVQASTADRSVLVDFAKFLHKNYESYPCHGVMGCRPINASDAATLRNFINDNYLATTHALVAGSTDQLKIGPFLANSPQMVEGTGDNQIQYGRYVTLVAGVPALIGNNQWRSYIETPYAPVAGLMASLGPANILAFRSPAGVLEVPEPGLPSDVASALIAGVPLGGGKYGGAYLAVRRNPLLGNQPAIVNDVTAANRDSMFAMQSNARVANAVLKSLRAALTSFLGKPNTAEVQAAMATTIRSVMSRLVELGALLGGEGLGYRFSINPKMQGLQMTEIEVLMDIVPAAFIRTISLRLTVRP